MARATATDKGRVDAVLGKEQVSLKDLGELIVSTENGLDYERIVTEKMEGMHLDVHGLKDKMHRSMACVGRSTDNVVCDLTPIVEFKGNVLIGIASTLDAVLTSLPLVKRQLNGLNLSVFADSLADMPAKTKISTANMSTEWKVERQGPFVETDLKEMLKLWEGRDVSGCGGGLKGIASAFYRQYFRSACRPAAMIQSYSCRQGRNRGKDKNLKNLPEGILHNLIGVVLDSVGLEKAELDKAAEELKGAPTDFWRSLGENNSDREEQLRKLQDCRAGWKAQLRRCVGRALAKVRLSPCENGVLTPRKVGSNPDVLVGYFVSNADPTSSTKKKQKGDRIPHSARLPPVPPPLPRHSARLRPVPPPLPRLRVVTQEGNGHEGPSVAARVEVEDTMQCRLSSEESSDHRLDARLKLLYYSNFVLHVEVHDRSHGRLA